MEEFLLKEGIEDISSRKQESNIKRYYNFQSKIYDWTRWSFLFGRKEIVRKIPFLGFDQFILAEIGSGTGYNLKHAAFHFPKAKLIGLDVSEDMVRKSRKKMKDIKAEAEIFHRPFKIGEQNFETPPEVILINYALTMMNPQAKAVIQQAKSELANGGYIAVADFHNSKYGWFKSHMANHHVRMEGDLQPYLCKLFEPQVSIVREAYQGLWQYFMFLGQKN